MHTQNNFQVDESNCDREPIHILGHIQPQGYYLACDADFSIVQHSANLPAYLGVAPETLPGKKLTALGFVGFDDKLRLLQIKKPKHIEPFELAFEKDGREDCFDAIAHYSGNKLIVELEPCVDDTPVSIYQELVTRLTYLSTRSHSSSDVLNRAATLIKKYTGYDRVMIYQFMKDGHGQVVAEEAAPGLEPFLGMYYPASDIPKQARELFVKNVVRIIGNVSATDVPLVPYLVDGKPTDLTYCNLRSVSPMHIQYLKNMGVKASFSISIIVEGSLWGLMACHHYEGPKFLPPVARQNCVLVSRLLSATIHSWLTLEEEELRNSTTATINTLVAQMKQNWNVPFGLTRYAVTMASLFSGTGAALVLDNSVYLQGNTPTEAQVRELVDWLQTTSDKLFETNRLSLLFPPAKLYCKQASGLLAITLSKELKEYVLWFKPELIEEVAWAGNPQKAVEVNQADGTVTLTPRSSFDKWTEELRLHSSPWKDAEIAGALQFREEVLQVINFKANELRRFNEKLRLANQELDAFSYTISHDLRTPLTTAYAYCEMLTELAEQNNDTESKDLLAKMLRNLTRMNDMIHAILEYARVNKTDVEKRPVNMRPLLQEIVATVTGAYKNNLVIRLGNTPDVQAEPVMVAQVFQNLVDNAAKYAASKPRPTVDISGEDRGDEIVYRIRDNGIGIDMKYADKIFEIFSRLHNTGSYSGYGVGLSIVKRIMERFDGKVWFESKVAEGSTFYIAFPKQAGT